MTAGFKNSTFGSDNMGPRHYDVALSTSGGLMRAPTTKQLRSQCWRLRFIVFAVILITSSGAWLGTRRGEAATISDLIRAGRIPAQLDDVPSHNRRYRASLLPPQKGANGLPSGWTLRLRGQDGTPVQDAALEVGVWMPEEPTVGADRL